MVVRNMALFPAHPPRGRQAGHKLPSHSLPLSQAFSADYASTQRRISSPLPTQSVSAPARLAEAAAVLQLSTEHLAT